ncbi:MAG: hypothetical protein ACJZ10_00565 [Candidatus Neomarinimicrobiota bacterium]
MLRIGSSIGADVPFFIKGGCQIGSGIGDQLIKVENSIKKTFLLVMPEFHISTQKQHLKNSKIFWTIIKKKLTLPTLLKRISSFLSFLRMILKQLLFQHIQKLDNIKKKLLNQGAVFSSLSGTGSTVYGVFDDDAKAISAESLFKVNYKTCIAHPVKNM